MVSPILTHFAHAMVHKLLAGEHIAVTPGQENTVITALAEHLARVQHASLVSEVSRILMAHTDVTEVYLDDDALKALIDTIDAADAGLADRPPRRSPSH